MGTAYIEASITAEEGSVCLFQTDCLAEVEYTISGNELCDWHISNLKFEQHAHEWEDGELQWRKKAEAWCPADLLKPLIARIDQNEIEEALLERLYSEGELSYANASLRADYHAEVM
jgi:hypothetical protein